MKWRIGVFSVMIVYLLRERFVLSRVRSCFSDKISQGPGSRLFAVCRFCKRINSGRTLDGSDSVTLLQGVVMCFSSTLMQHGECGSLKAESSRFWV